MGPHHCSYFIQRSSSFCYGVPRDNWAMGGNLVQHILEQYCFLGSRLPSFPSHRDRITLQTPCWVSGTLPGPGASSVQEGVQPLILIKVVEEASAPAVEGFLVIPHL